MSGVEEEGNKAKAGRVLVLFLAVLVCSSEGVSPLQVWASWSSLFLFPIVLVFMDVFESFKSCLKIFRCFDVFRKKPRVAIKVAQN